MNRSFLRRGMVAASVAAGTAAIALAAVLPAATASASTASPARTTVTAAAKASPAWSDVLVDCAHKGVVMPSSFTLTCADDNDFLSGLHWTYWHSMANGWGWENLNSCQPSCVAGKFHKFRVLVTAWRQRTRAHWEYKYTRLTVIYTHRRPLRYKNGKKHHPLTMTWHLP